LERTQVVPRPIKIALPYLSYDQLGVDVIIIPYVALDVPRNVGTAAKAKSSIHVATSHKFVYHMST
jgi:hypothetical protein